MTAASLFTWAELLAASRLLLRKNKIAFFTKHDGLPWVQVSFPIKLLERKVGSLPSICIFGGFHISGNGGKPASQVCEDTEICQEQRLAMQSAATPGSDTRVGWNLQLE